MDPHSHLPSAVSPGEDYWFVDGIGCPLFWLGIDDGDEVEASEPFRDARLLWSKVTRTPLMIIGASVSAVAVCVWLLSAAAAWFLPRPVR